MNWIHQAACRGHDPELWFSTRPSKTKTALAVCRTCPVIGECREWADGHSRINGYPLQPKRPEFLEPRYALEKPAGIGDNRRES